MNWVKFKNPIKYKDAVSIMENAVQEVIQKPNSERIFLLEHEEVYTFGTSANKNELINDMGIPVIQTGRGGKFTYHGPGQRIIYPILNLNLREKDIKKYIFLLEMSIINTFNILGINAFIMKDNVGIWVNNNGKISKIAAIGIRAKQWVTYHGMCVNISNDLNKFLGIIPCGIKDFGVTSLLECGIVIDFDEFDSILMVEFDKLFKY
jgi:lipoyl(octanoyl) transferase